MKRQIIIETCLENQQSFLSTMFILMVFIFVIVFHQTTYAQLWHPVNPGQDTTFTQCSFHDTITGDHYIGGSFKYWNGVLANNVIRWDGQQWHPMGDGFNDRVLAIGKYKGELYAAGYFDSSGVTKFTMPIAKWTGTSWVPIDTAFNILQHPGSTDNPYIEDLVEYDNRLFILGHFYAYPPPFPPPPGWQQFENFAYWNDTTWLPGTFYSSGGVSIADPGQNMVVFNNELYIGTIGYDTCPAIPTPKAWVAGLRRYDPVCRSFQQVGSWGPGLRRLKVFNGSLYLGYGYYHAQYGNCITRFDGVNFHPMGDGFNSDVYDLFEYNNQLMAVGTFSANSTNTVLYPSRIAYLNGNAWMPFQDTCNITLGGFGIGDGLAIDSLLIVTGGLGNCNGQPLGYCASYPHSITGINELESSGSIDVFQIHPNPAFTSVTLSRKGHSALKLNRIFIQDISGRVVNRISLNSGDHNISLNVEGYEPGIYLLSLEETDGKSVVFKLMIQN